LLVSTEPVAASTAVDVKFSEAISWSVVDWRSISAARSERTSGSAVSHGSKGDPDIGLLMGSAAFPGR
jgi:hypothetical protein